MNKNKLTFLLVFFIISICVVFAQVTKKISEYPNTTTLYNNDLFIIASGSTNKNIKAHDLLSLMNYGSNGLTLVFSNGIRTDPVDVSTVAVGLSDFLVFSNVTIAAGTNYIRPIMTTNPVYPTIGPVIIYGATNNCNGTYYSNMTYHTVTPERDMRVYTCPVNGYGVIYDPTSYEFTFNVTNSFGTLVAYSWDVYDFVPMNLYSTPGDGINGTITPSPQVTSSGFEANFTAISAWNMTTQVVRALTKNLASNVFNTPSAGQTLKFNAAGYVYWE